MKRKNNVTIPRDLVEDLLLIAEKHLNKTPVRETVIFDKDTGKTIRTVNYCKTIKKGWDELDRQSHWVGIKYDDACCSNCGGHITTHFDSTQRAIDGWGDLYPFCPHCGAKMDLTANFKTRTGGRR